MLAHSRQVKDPRIGSQGRFVSIRSSTHHIPRAWPARASRSSPARVRHGTRTRSARRLIVTAGFGRVQRWGGPVEEIRPGDVVWFAPGEKHWHGASPTTAMTHIAIQEKLDGKAVEWMEHVSDDQYLR